VSVPTVLRFGPSNVLVVAETDSFPPRPLSKRCEEVRQRHVQCSDKLAERRDPDFPLPALDASDVIPMQIRARGQFFLRDAQLPS